MFLFSVICINIFVIFISSLLVKIEMCFLVRLLLRVDCAELFGDEIKCLMPSASCDLP